MAGPTCTAGATDRAHGPNPAQLLAGGWVPAEHGTAACGNGHGRAAAKGT